MDLQTFFTTLIGFINGVVIPFMIGTAFFIFIVNIIRYFILGGGNKESQEKARSTALYGLFAFVFLIIFWGIVNMLTGSFDLTPSTTPCSDYDPTC